MKNENYILSNYGKERETFLKSEKPELYFKLKNSDKLMEHLIEIDKEACEMEDSLVVEYSRSEGVTEELKKADMFEWVKKVNSIKNRAQEIVYNTLIYIWVVVVVFMQTQVLRSQIKASKEA